jgi:hypothetical protein
VKTSRRILGALGGLGLALTIGGLGLGLGASTSGAADPPATVTVVHGIPSVGDVDVCVGTTPLLSAVPFKGVATISVPAGTYDLTVNAAATPACSGAVAISAPGTAVPSGAVVSVVANIAGGTPNLAVYADDVDPVAGGSGRVAVYHAANAPAVDVLVNGGPGLTDLTQKTTQSADLPAASYDFTVTPTGDPSTTVLDLPDVSLPAGKLLQVFAVGAVPDEGGQNPFQVITNVVDLQTATAPTTAPTTTTVVPSATPAPAATSNPAMTG